MKFSFIRRLHHQKGKGMDGKIQLKHLLLCCMVFALIKNLIRMKFK